MGSSLLVTEGDGFSLSVKKPKAIIKGERGEIFSLLVTEGAGSAETEGVGFSPLVKKPKVQASYLG